jgi:hypothetical protein
VCVEHCVHNFPIGRGLETAKSLLPETLNPSETHGYSGRKGNRVSGEFTILIEPAFLGIRYVFSFSLCSYHENT